MRDPHQRLLALARRFEVRTEDHADRAVVTCVLGLLGVDVNEPSLSTRSDAFLVGLASGIVKRLDGIAAREERLDAAPGGRTKEQAINPDPGDLSTRSAAGTTSALPPAANAAELRRAITLYKSGQMKFTTPDERAKVRSWLLKRAQQLGVEAPRLDGDDLPDEREAQAASKRRMATAYQRPCTDAYTKQMAQKAKP